MIYYGMGFYLFFRSMKKILALLFTVCFGSFAYAETVTVLLPHVKNYACLIEESSPFGSDPNTSSLIRYFNDDVTDYVAKSFDDRIRAYTRKYRKLRQLISETTDEILIAALKNRRVRIKRKRGEVKRCRDQEGVFNIDFGDPIGIPGGGGTGGGGTAPGNVEPCSAVAGSQNILSRIINGDSCFQGNSAVVELELFDPSNNYVGSCSGTVIASRTIITAAHCLEGVTKVNIYTGVSSHVSSKVSAHSSFSNSEKNDVGVVVSSTDILTKKIKVLSSSLFAGETVVIAGFGLDESDNYGSLKAARNTINSFTTGAISITYDGGSEGNTCFGDSGGPLLVQRNGTWFLAGVTSNGVREDCGVGDISNFANLLDTSNRNFINSVVPGAL